MAISIKNFLQHDSFLNTGSLGLCAVASFEMGCRSVVNLNTLRSTTNKEEGELRSNLTANLSGALLFGLAAANLAPGTRKAAAAGLLIFSFFKFLRHPEGEYRKKEYFVGRAITLFPDQAYQGYQAIKAKLNLPSHPSWYLLIGLITLVGCYQLGKTYNYFSANKSS